MTIIEVSMFSDCADKRPARQGEDMEAARRLWVLSEKLVGYSMPSEQKVSSYIWELLNTEINCRYVACLFYLIYVGNLDFECPFGFRMKAIGN